MKMSSLRTFILIFGLLLFGSCAKKGKKETKLKFTLGALFIADGDAMLWGKNMSNGESFGEIISLAPVERDLSFGQWNFYVTAWGGGENVVPLSGKAICDFKSVMIDDSAGVPEVSFNLENAKCALPAFGPSVNTLTTDIPSTLHYFPPIRVMNCQNVNGPTNASDWANCERGFYSSYQIVAKEFGLGSGGGELVSECTISNQADGYQSDTLLANVPHGDGNAPFKYFIRGYFGSSDCDETANPGIGDPFGYKEFDFPNGLSGGSTGTRNMPHLGNTCILGMGQPGTGTAGGCDGHSIVCVGGTEDGKVLTAATCVAGGGAAAAHTGSFVNDSTASKISIILPSSQGDVCQTGRMNSTFAGGTGHPGRPYLICTPNQFNGIDDDVTLVTKAFEIVSDLNFDLATNSNCAAYGIAVNTNPIGGALDSADPTCQTYVTQQDFTGSLDGRNNNINFARFRNGGLSGSGLLISNIGTGGVVKNINLTNSEIGISHTGGLIAGDCFGGTIDTIVVDESMVELEEDGGGVANAGGIVGTTTNCAMSNLYLYGVDVEGRGSYVGGVVGNAVGSYIAGVDFFGGVNSRPDNGGDATFIGGIAGKSQTNISGAVVQGGVSGSLKVGGIAGEGTTASHVIDDSYVLAHISSDKMVNDDATKLFIGGIIGNSSNGTITKTMFMGSISHQCQHTTSANCGVAKFSGSKVGTGLGGINENYTQSEYTSINGLAADIGHHGVEITYAAFRDSSHTGGFSTYDFTVSGRWSHVNGDVPRFKRHNWECELPANLDTVANQVTAGRGGTLSNAIQLCNVNQFKEIKVNSDKIYKVADNFSLFGISDTDLTTSFSGQLWGDDKVLFGGEITGTQSQLGLFRAIAASGKVIDLNLAGFKNLTTGYNNQAVLAGLNYGLIEDVEIHGGVAKAPLYVGLVASKNMETGVIKNVTVSGLVRGGTFAGGIAGVNLYSNGINSSGIIEKVTSRALIHPYNGSSTIAGGIVGQNQGVVREALMAGRIEDDLATPTYFTQDIGGIAGTNTNDGSTTNGSIINSNFSGYSEIRISATANVGGIAGSNDGPIDKTVVEGRVNYDTPGAIPTSYGAIVGNNNLPSEVTARNYYQRDPFRYYSPNFNYNGGGCTDGAGTTTFSITNFSFSPHSPSSHFLRIDFDDNLLIPVSQYSSLTTVVAIGNFCTEIIASGQIDILEMQPAVTEGTKLAGTAFYDINSYCAGASLGGIYFQCSSAGFDITEEYQGVDGIGTQRVLDYYMAEMNGQTLPAYPMWVLESGNDNPPRLFIENNN